MLMILYSCKLVEIYIVTYKMSTRKTGQRTAEYRFNVHVSTVASCVMSINLTYEGIVSSMAKLRANKASEPDSVTPKLLKFIFDFIIPSLLSVFDI